MTFTAAPIRLAFIGIDHPHGAAWRELLRHFSQKLELAAIVPAFGHQLASLEERYADLPRFADVDALLADDDFDAGVVCLPNHEAATAAIKLASAKKHVLLEKPGAQTAGDLAPLVQAVSHHGVAFQSGYLWRYDQGANRLKSMVEDGRFGQLISVEMTYVTSDIRRRGADHYLFDRATSKGGFFHWLACHYLDLLLYITTRKVVGVTARTDVFGGTPVDVDDGGVAILDLEGGGLAVLFGGYWLPRWSGESLWCLRGTERWVHWRPHDAGGLLHIHGPQPHWHAMEETFVLPDDTAPGYGGYRGVALVEDWIRAMEEGTECRNTVISMQTALQLIDAIYESSAQGRRIECQIGPESS